MADVTSSANRYRTHGVQAAEVGDDAALVARVIAGDAAAFAEIYERHHAPLFRTALAMTRRKQVAEEILQEAFLRAYRHLGRVRLESSASLRPWLHRIVIRLVYDWSARRSARMNREVASSELRSLLSPERFVERNEQRRIVTEAIDELPFKQRIVVVLYYLHDMDLNEIEATLGVPAGTVKSRLYYARTKLRARLAADRRIPVGRVLGELIR